MERSLSQKQSKTYGMEDECFSMKRLIFEAATDLRTLGIPPIRYVTRFRVVTLSLINMKKTKNQT